MTTAQPASPTDLDTHIRSGVAAQMLGVSAATINRLIHQGALTVLRRTPGGHFMLSYRQVVTLQNSLLGPDPTKAKRDSGSAGLTKIKPKPKAQAVAG